MKKDVYYIYLLLHRGIFGVCVLPFFLSIIPYLTSLLAHIIVSTVCARNGFTHNTMASTLNGKIPFHS